MTFAGIPDEAFAFYEGLAADSSKVYWTAHKEVYERCVREPMTALLAELEDEFGPGHLFRPYRDVRFSRDKSPYKDHQGAYVEVSDAVGYYVQVHAGGLMVAGGWYAPSPAQVARYREVVSGPGGVELEGLVAAVAGAGIEIGGDRLATRPRGVDPGHPRLELLRHRSLVGERHWEPEPWVHTAAALDRVRASWRELGPLVTWLAATVGPGEPRRPGR